MSETTYVVRSRYKSSGQEMETQYLLSTHDHGEHIDSMGKSGAILQEAELDRLTPHRTTMLPNLEDLARLGRIAQALLDGREPSPKNYDLKEEGN